MTDRNRTDTTRIGESPAIRTPHPWWSIIAPFFVLAIASLACGSFAPRPTPAPTPIATPTPVPDRAPTVEAGGVVDLPTSVPTRAAPTPTFTPTPVPGTTLVVGQPARVVAADGLNVRKDAGVSGERIGRFAPNARVIVLEGPVDTDGYRWWRVGTNQLAGWVAEGDGAEAWLSAQIGERRPVSRAVRLGDDVVVTTGEGGFLKVRIEPGLGAPVEHELDSESQLNVTEGPVEADGYRWWKVTDGQDVTGWAAEGDNTDRWLTPLE